MSDLHCRIRDIDEKDLQRIKAFALEKTGKPSIANLIKRLLIDLSLIQSVDTSMTETKSKRLYVRLPDNQINQFSHLAKESNMTVNRFALMILQSYMQTEPVLTTKEVEALYQSNAQLLMLGRNLNQIARALNNNEATSLNTKTLTDIQSTLKDHTAIVGQLIRANHDRMP